MTTRSRIFALLFVSGGVALVCGGGVAAFFGIQQYRRTEMLKTAQSAYDREDWPMACIALSRYLPNDPANFDMLRMYAEANSHILDDRPTALRNVAQAYHQMLQYDPGNIEAYEVLLNLYERQGAWDVLEYYTAEWLRRDPNNRALLGARALALDKSGSRDDALAAYEALFEHHPGEPHELSRYANLVRERSTAAAAEKFLDRLLNNRPGDPGTLVATARYWLDAGDIESAKHFVDRATVAAPDFRALRVLRARIAASDRRWDEALAQLDLLTNAELPDAELISLRGNILVAGGDIEAAASLLADTPPAVRVDHPRLQILLIDSWFGLNRLTDARDASELYLQAYPLDTATRNYVEGRDALAEGRHGDAAKALAIAVELRSDFRAARLALAVAEIASGNTLAGRSVLEAYLRENPGDGRAKSLWAKHFDVDLDEADRLAIQSLGGNPKDASALMSAAALIMDAAEREGELASRASSIEKLAERALAADSASAAPYSLLVVLSLRLGDVATAREVLDQAGDAGVNALELNDLAGMLAIAEGAIEDAWSVFEVARSNLDGAGIRKWARLFASAGAYSKALSVFGEAELSDHAVERAELAAEFGPLGEARDVLQGNESDSIQFNRARLLLSIRYAESTNEDRDAVLTRLAKEAGESTSDGYALTVRAMAAQYGESPDAHLAESLLRGAETNAPDEPLVLDRLRAFYETEKQPDAALQYAERVCAMAPSDDHYRFALGRLQVSNGLFGEAEKTLRGVLDRQPENLNVRKVLVQSLLESDQVDAADKLLAEFPRANEGAGRETDRLRGQVMMARKSYVEAELLLRERVDEAPNDTNARWALAECLRALDRETEAEQLMRNAATVEAASAEDWSLLARFYVERDEVPALEEAAGAALRALLIDPDHAEALRTLAGIRERQDEAAAALAILRRYTDARPDDGAAWYRRAQLELSTGGQWADALASVDRAYAISEAIEYRALRGFIHARLKDYSSAIEDLEEAAADLPATSAQFDLALGECYVFTDSFEQADRYLAAAERKLERAGALSPPILKTLRSELASRRKAQ